MYIEALPLKQKEKITKKEERKYCWAFFSIRSTRATKTKHTKKKRQKKQT